MRFAFSYPPIFVLNWNVWYRNTRRNLWLLFGMVSTCFNRRFQLPFAWYFFPRGTPLDTGVFLKEDVWRCWVRTCVCVSVGCYRLGRFFSPPSLWPAGSRSEPEWKFAWGDTAHWYIYSSRFFYGAGDVIGALRLYICQTAAAVVEQGRS